MKQPVVPPKLPTSVKRASPAFLMTLPWEMHPGQRPPRPALAPVTLVARIACLMAAFLKFIRLFLFAEFNCVLNLLTTVNWV